MQRERRAQRAEWDRWRTSRASPADRLDVGHNALVSFWVVVAVLAVVSLYLWVVSIRYAADITTVRAPNGFEYDVLVNPDGVAAYSNAAGWTNALGCVPAVVGLVRRKGDRRGWAVRVRPHPFNGYDDLLDEVTSTREAALSRQTELVSLIAKGTTLWPRDAEWFR